MQEWLMFAEVGAPIEESLSVWEIMLKGGVVMWLIFAASVVALGVFLERAMFYHRCRLRLAEFLPGLVNLLRREQYIEALERLDEAYGPVVDVMRTAITRRTLPPDQLREVTREVAQLKLPGLENNLAMLSTIGLVAPLLGLFGTVLGMIQAFGEISAVGGAAPVGNLADGIWTALLTTAAGLAVAIPCYVAYNYLVTRMQGIIADMERAGIEIIHVLIDPDKDAASDVIRRMPAASDQ